MKRGIQDVLKISLCVCRMSLKPVMHNETVCQVNTLLTLLEGSLQSAAESPAAATDPAAAAAHMERIFIYCLTWSLGGLLHENDRPAFDSELRNLASAAIMPAKVNLDLCFGVMKQSLGKL